MAKFLSGTVIVLMSCLHLHSVWGAGSLKNYWHLNADLYLLLNEVVGCLYTSQSPFHYPVWISEHALLQLFGCNSSDVTTKLSGA